MDEFKKLEKMLKSGMPYERFQQQEAKPEWAEDFRTTLQKILTQEVTPENLDQYFVTALNEVISLSEKITHQYKMFGLRLPRTQKSLEDQSFSYFGVTSIDEILSTIQQKQALLQQSTEWIKQKIQKSDEVLLPPGGSRMTHGGIANFVERGTHQRLEAIVYLLADGGVSLDSCILKKGIVTDSMIRRESYVYLYVPSIHRLVLVCDEEGNATYVFDTSTFTDSATIENLAFQTKEELDALILQKKVTGRRLVFRSRWLQNTRNALFSPIVSADKDAEVPESSGPRVSESEIDPWRSFYTDPAGRHWGTIIACAARLGFERHDAYNKREEVQGLDTQTVTIENNKQHPCVCFEEFQNLPSIQKLLIVPKVEQSGEWKGFHVEAENLHWGAIADVAAKFELDRDLLNYAIAKSQHAFRRKPLRNRNFFDAYLLEEIQQVFTGSNILQKPMYAEKEGEWQDFVITQGKHWSTNSHIASKLNIPEWVVRKIQKRLRLKSTLVRALIGRRGEFLIPLEDVRTELERIRSTPLVQFEGEWSGFASADNKHWALAPAIAAQLSVSKDTVLNRGKKFNLQKRTIRVSEFEVDEVFSLEDIAGALAIQPVQKK